MREYIHELFLLSNNLTEIQDSELVVKTFIERVNTIFEGCEFQWRSEDIDPNEKKLAVRAKTKTFGYIHFLMGASLSGESYPLFENAVLFLGVTLQNLEYDVLLSDQKTHLNHLVDESERKFKSMTDNSPLAIYMSSGVEQVAEYMNPIFTQFFGYTIEEIPSAAEWWPLAYPDEEYRKQVSEEWQGKVAEAIRTNSEIEKMETIVRCKNGTVKNISWGFISTGVQNWAFGLDLTEQKQAEAALNQRIIALTEPLDETLSIGFNDLFNLEDIQKLQDDFALATGVATIITETDGTPITQPGNFTHLCNGIIRKTSKGCENCYKSDTEIGKLSTKGPSIKTCLSGGLWDAGAGISVGGKHIANWLIGQVRDEEQSEENIRAYAREIGADEEETAKAYRDVPAMKKEQFDNIAQMLFTLATQLSTLAYQNIQQARFIGDRKQAVSKLRQSEENLRVTLNSIGDAVIVTDTNGAITSMNPVAEEMTGWPAVEAKGNALPEVFNVIHSESREAVENPADKVLSTGEISELGSHSVLVARDGTEYKIADSGAPILSDTGVITGVVLVFRNRTEEYALQEKLKQSQRLDAIGQLAGGIAHDFNNMLGGIMGGTQLLKNKIPDDAKNLKYLSIIEDSAERAADLTGKLLTFSRRQAAPTQVMNIHDAISEAITLLENSIDKRISIVIDNDSESNNVLGDRSQLLNVFLNLGINASHAMPEGGTITIQTKVIELSSSYCKTSAFDLKPGQYVEVVVLDTGVGVNSKDIPYIFDPFYTTKEQGQGTGLGLASVYGAIQQHNGEITVSSELNQGTVFRVHIPLTGKSEQAQYNSGEIIKGSGSILLVDDEPIMRTVAKEFLEQFGYTVYLAENGQVALDVYRELDGAIDLVILDMIMPVMNGRDCFVALQKLNQNLPILLASGFAHSKDLDALKGMGCNDLIHKPYKKSKLSQLVSDILHREKSKQI